MPKTFVEYFSSYLSEGGKTVWKNGCYASVYETLLSPYKGTNIVVAELGVSRGGSLQMWKEYFGSKASIWGIDRDPVLFYEEEQIKCILADQSSKESLMNIPKSIPYIDIFIDDGSHIGWHQVQTFEIVFPIISKGGLYVCEDVYTNLRKDYQGGLHKEGTFIEYSKLMIDAFHHTEDARIYKCNNFNEIYNVSFYDGMIVVKKKGELVLK